MSSFSKTIIAALSFGFVVFIISSASLGDEIGEVLGGLFESDPYPQEYQGGQYNENEYWVYIQPKDDITTPEMISGRAQKGDVIDIIPTARGKGGYSQSKDFLVIKVANLTEEQKKKLLERVYGDEEGGEGKEGKEGDNRNQKFERKYRLDMDNFKSQKEINKEKGTVPITIDASEIIPVEKSKEEIARYEQKARFYAKTLWLRKLARKIIPSAKAATTNTFYVDPDAAAGGDGTTNALSGANCAFQSLNIWESARDADITLATGSDSIEEAVVDSNGEAHTADGTAVELFGWTTSATNYVYIHTPTTSRHNGTYSTIKYRMEINNGNPIANYTNHVRIEGLQFYSHTPSAAGRRCVYLSTITGASDVRLGGNIFKGHGSATYSENLLEINDLEYTILVYNNLFFDLNTASNNYAILNTNSSATKLYNNTLISGEVGYISSAGTATFINNLFNGFGYGIYMIGGTVDGASDYNATDDASFGSGYTANTHDHTSHTFSFVNAGADDYHLQSTDTGAIDLGTSDPASGLYSVDIDMETRSGTWDIGADEYVRTYDPVIFKRDVIFRRDVQVK